MLYDFTHFKFLDSVFDPQDNIFLNQQIDYYKEHRPLDGFKLLQNIPLTIETLKKVESLLYSGAKVTVTALSFVPPVQKAVDILQSVGVEVIIDHSQIQDDFDIILDCSAEFRHFTPKFGCVELTKTGVNLYNKEDLSFPVIDIDSTRTKEIETVLGTGDGFIRSFLQLTNLNDLQNQKICVFGFGKVGQGIVRKIKEYHGKVDVIEVSNEQLLLTKKMGLNHVNGNDLIAVEQSLKSSHAVISATGINGIISKKYDPNLFIGKILANMGGGDEFGHKFPEITCLANKAPINFSSDKPTLMKYIDPIFYLHNFAAEILTQYNLQNGVHILHKDKDISVSSAWEKFHKESI